MSYILPLYSHRDREVQPHSGLNQREANGRPRNLEEVYIPIPRAFYNHYGNVLPNRNTPFSLTLPDGTILSAKICQDGNKALMSNPNSDLGHWLFGQLGVNPNNILTNQDLTNAGFDSVILTPDGTGGFYIDVNRVPNAFETLMGKPAIF